MLPSIVERSPDCDSHIQQDLIESLSRLNIHRTNSTDTEHRKNIYNITERCPNDSSHFDGDEVSSLLYHHNEDGDTSLHLAVIHQNLPHIADILCTMVLQQSLDKVNHMGQTALHLAVVTGQTSVARTLLVCGASIYVRDFMGRTPLHLACEQKDIAMVKALTLPLDDFECSVANRKSYNIHVEDLLEGKDLVNFDGESALYIAAKTGDVNIVKYLVDECNCDINIQELRAGKTILHLAIELHNIALVEYVVHHPKSDLSIRDYSGNLALELANYPGYTLPSDLYTTPYRDHIRG